MAVDYFHRLLIVGTPKDVSAFRRQMHREYPRTIGGKTWTEIVPFSFHAVYELAPAARRIEAEVPHDPYELSAWPPRRISNRRAEVRYQFQTRNMEMVGLLRALSRALPSLTFTLVTLCLDDSSIEAARFSRGRAQRWFMDERACEPHWDRARKKFGLPGEEVYDDDEADYWTEQQMLHAAMAHWDRKSARRPGRRRDWDNRVRLRDLDTERELTMYEIAEAMALKTRRKRRSANRARRGRKAAT